MGEEHSYVKECSKSTLNSGHANRTTRMNPRMLNPYIRRRMLSYPGPNMGRT